MFDNSDGKIGGPYASYNEVALRRAVSRDGTSDYFINGIKVRRKDITQLFLGTGLGTRSYAIIEQGMISRVIEARPDDLRAFLEEAAGISRYKERRRETESRIGHTRENLDRLNDLREEVEKQIRHLQRQAATARRYQTLKEEERKLPAELLALRLQSLDSEAGVRDAATSGCETAMQAVLADLREAEAQIERIRADQSAKADALNAIQGRFYEAGAEVTRIEQGIEYARELRQRQRADLEQVDAQTAELDRVVQLDRVQLEALSMELSTMVPGLDAGARSRESRISSTRALRAGADIVAVLLGQPRPSGGAGAARDAGRTGAHRAIGKPAAAAAAAAGAAGIGARVVRAAAATRRRLETLAERADAARAAGESAAAELQELLSEISAAREREREAEPVAQCAARPLATGAGRAGLDRSTAAGRARQSLRTSHAMAQVSVARS